MAEKAFVPIGTPAAPHLNEQFAESWKLEKAIRSNVEGLGNGG